MIGTPVTTTMAAETGQHPSRLGSSAESSIGLVTAHPGHTGSTETIDIVKEAHSAGRRVA